MAARFFLLLLSTLCLLSASYFATEAWLLKSGKAENVRRATRWMPWSVEAWRLMPQVEPARAAEHWRHVLQLAPYDTEARLALATEAELAGHAHQAEALLLDAARYNKGYLPAWTLANFYLRQYKEAEFWRWARRAATFEVDLTALFELALRLRPDPPALLQEFALKRSDAIAQLLTAASHQDLLEPALPVAQLVARSSTAATREQLLWSADALLKNGRTAAALAYWNLAAPYPPQPPPTLFNGDFTRVSLERGFDWRPGSAEVSLNMGRGLHIGLYGKQEDTAVLLVQTTVLEPGRAYELQYRYRTNLPADAHPVRWQMGESASSGLEPGDWHEATWRIMAPTESTDLKLVSHYEPGTRRAQGEIEIAWVRIPRTIAESATRGPGTK
jgi:hypothetical protein